MDSMMKGSMFGAPSGGGAPQPWSPPGGGVAPRPEAPPPGSPGGMGPTMMPLGNIGGPSPVASPGGVVPLGGTDVLPLPPSGTGSGPIVPPQGRPGTGAPKRMAERPNGKLPKRPVDPNRYPTGRRPRR